MLCPAHLHFESKRLVLDWLTPPLDPYCTHCYTGTSYKRSFNGQRSKEEMILRDGKKMCLDPETDIRLHKE